MDSFEDKSKYGTPEFFLISKGKIELLSSKDSFLYLNHKNQNNVSTYSSEYT